MNLYTYLRLLYLFKRNAAFIWHSNNKNFESVEKVKSLPLNLLVGIDRQKKSLYENTYNFANNNFTNNALLWGTRGNGKSTLIKSIFNEINYKFTFLKLIQINKNDLLDIHHIYLKIEKLKNFRFILFIDDLSFENIDKDYKIIKSTLDGGLQNQPKNVTLYVTSNRRHLMPREMIDNEKSSAIHTDESVEEKISLSDRFGLWIGFHNISQNEYLEIIRTYFKHFKININESILKKSIQWSLERGNRTGRTAWQFIIKYSSDNNLKINF
tara:strand:- start:381 stop:1187 length:807 start_codon:yes stop_codon:yes gene_type:complete